MKILKTIVLGVLAATALMATVGVGSAAATETALCKAQTTKSGLPICEGVHLYQTGTNVHAELEKGAVFAIENAAVTVECLKSTLEFTTEAETAIPLGATVNNFTFEACNGEITTTKKGTLDIELIDLPVFTHNGTLTFTEPKSKWWWAPSSGQSNVAMPPAIALFSQAV